VAGQFSQVVVAQMDQQPGHGVLLTLAVAEGPQLRCQVTGRLARNARHVAQRRGPALWPVTAGAGQRTLGQCVWHGLGRRGAGGQCDQQQHENDHQRQRRGDQRQRLQTLLLGGGALTLADAEEAPQHGAQVGNDRQGSEHGARSVKCTEAPACRSTGSWRMSGPASWTTPSQ